MPWACAIVLGIKARNLMALSFGFVGRGDQHFLFLFFAFVDGIGSHVIVLIIFDKLTDVLVLFGGLYCPG